MRVFDTDCRNCMYSECLYVQVEDKKMKISKNKGVYCSYPQYHLDNTLKSPIRNEFELDERCGYYKEE